MKKVKFHFKLTSVGALETVKFFPEDAQVSINIAPDSKAKVWENKSFELAVDNPFEYELVIFGVSGTKWEAELKIINGNTEEDFLSWSGITGDSANNVSRRLKPVKNVN